MPDYDGTPIYVGEGLEHAGTEMNGRAAQILDELDALRRQLQPLIDTWIAQSSDFYQERMLEWDHAAINLFGDQSNDGVLGKIAHVMNVNWANYADAEEANIKTWRTAG